MHKDHIALRLGELQKHTLFFPQLALGVAKHIKQLVYRAPEIRQRVVFAGDAQPALEIVAAGNLTELGTHSSDTRARP